VVSRDAKQELTSAMSPAAARPVCDEWGFYDPAQAGFEAVLRRLRPDDDPTGIPVASATPAPVSLP
jgi:hypothetical protein